jgi:hypothetical protein
MAVALIAKHNRRAQVGRTDGVDMLECGAEKIPFGAHGCTCKKREQRNKIAE